MILIFILRVAQPHICNPVARILLARPHLNDFANHSQDEKPSDFKGKNVNRIQMS